MKLLFVLTGLFSLSVACSAQQIPKILINNNPVVSGAEAIRININDEITLVFTYMNQGDWNNSPDTLMVKGCFAIQRQQQQQQQQNAARHNNSNHNSIESYDRSYYAVLSQKDHSHLTKTYAFKMNNHSGCQGRYYPAYLLKNNKKINPTWSKFYLNE